jgi:hypothetical protein
MYALAERAQVCQVLPFRLVGNKGDKVDLVLR